MFEYIKGLSKTTGDYFSQMELKNILRPFLTYIGFNLSIGFIPWVIGLAFFSKYGSLWFLFVPMGIVTWTWVYFHLDNYQYNEVFFDYNPLNTFFYIPCGRGQCDYDHFWQED